MLPQFSVKKPVTTVMCMLGLMMFGAISLMRLPQELFPTITYPQLTVVTLYANAAPEEIETLITKPIEEAVGTVSGLRRIKSVSREGISLVIGQFGWSENMDFAALRVREKIDLIKERLPRESGEPLVMKYNPFEMPVMTLSITGKRTAVELREFTRVVIKDALEKIDGVASATISGGLEPEILVDVDQARLSAQDVPLMDVTRAITNANLNYPAGTIKESFYEYLIRTMGEFKHIDEIKNIPVKTFRDESTRYMPEETQEKEISHETDIVLLKDVANVSNSYKERTSYSRYNLEENVSVSVQKQAQSNTIRVVSCVKATLNAMKKELPKDINIVIVFDQSKFIKNSINGVKNAGMQGSILVIAVIYYFLRNILTSIIVSLSIPISILAVFVLMYAGGLSINMISLAGLALGVGMVVDNSIVVLENIARRKMLGESSLEASVQGADEVTGAITGSTLTTIVVFFPMVFAVGIVGQIIKDLAFTIIFSLSACLLVALTVVPLMSARVKKMKTVEAMHKLTGGLERWLNFFLKKRSAIYFIILIFSAVSAILYLTLDKELMPKVDQGQFIVKVNMPMGTKLDVTNRVVLKIEKFITGLSDVENVSIIAGSTKGKGAEDVLQRLGSNEAEIIVDLKSKRKIKTGDIVQYVKNNLSNIDLEGARIEYVLQESIFKVAVEVSSPVVIEVKGKDIPIMLDITKKVESLLKGVKGIYGIKTDIPEPSPETKIVVDKDKAATYHFSVVDIAQTTQAAIRGYVASEFKEKGREIDIRVRLRESDRNTFDKISRIELNSPAGMRVPLASLVKIVPGKGPSEIKRLDQERTIIVSANIFKRALKDVIKDIEAGLKKLDFPETYTVRLTGESEEMKESFSSLIAIIIIAILLVYMVMAAQFESLWQPFVIMFTVPLALIGVIFALFITHTSLNVMAYLGIVILGGIVVNNGIVLIDYVNILLSKGTPVKDALIEASKTRLRPILMTAITTIVGFIPMAVARGEGTELNAPLAISVMGGLTVSTFLSLLVIPAVYLSFHNFRLRFSKKG